jgi:S1-C subfamily serine protease
VPLQSATQTGAASLPLPTLGIGEMAVSDVSGSHIQVTRVHPGSPAEKAGMHVDDTIISVNGYLAQIPGNLAWIINHHAPGGVITLVVRKAVSAENITVTATLQ